MKVGQTIDRWQVARLLGTGGVASVWSLVDPVTGETCALKLLELPSPKARSRFVREGAIQAALIHPHIVSVLGQIVVDGAPGLLLELVDGAPLSAVLAYRRLTRREAMGVFHGILLAVNWAHERGIVHRDIKPANVLLGLVAGGVVARVCDFGLAKTFFEDSPLTAGNAALGTPEYMAPEQFEDAASADLRADVFSLGAMLWELLLGSPPWSGPDLGTQLVARQSPLRAASDLGDLETLVRSCLAFAPNDRPANAGILLQALWPGDPKPHAPPVPGLELLVSNLAPSPTLDEAGEPDFGR